MGLKFSNKQEGNRRCDKQRGGEEGVCFYSWQEGSDPREAPQMAQ